MSRPLYTRLAAGLVFPLHELIKGHTTVAHRRALERSQWWPQERLNRLQLERLHRLLDHARRTVPYYRARFAEIGFAPRHLERVDDLRALPFLTKDLIRQNCDALRSVEARGLARFNTGGSSGEPLVFFLGKERVSRDVAAKWRATRWWDVDIGDREIVLWGSPIELGTQDSLRNLRDRLLRTRLLPAFEMSDAKVAGFLDVIRTTRPRMLFGYPSALAHIAGYARSTGVPLDDLGIRVAFVTSEMLYPDQRQTIEESFGCRVANGYGGRDAGFIAHECPAGGMHVTAEDIVVEIVDAEGRSLPHGRPGEVVVTHLGTADFPFIRYRTGDVAAWADKNCACGRGLPLLQEIQGRTTDFLVASDGTIMHGLALIYIVRDRLGVRKFKILQEDLQHTRILLVTDAAFDEGDVERIRHDARQRLGADVEVTVERVTDIPSEASGKYRYVVSRVATRPPS